MCVCVCSVLHGSELDSCTCISACTECCVGVGAVTSHWDASLMSLVLLCVTGCSPVSVVKDTRQEEEFQVSHLPGARHVEFDERNISELAQSLDPARPGGWEGQRGRSRWVWRGGGVVGGCGETEGEELVGVEGWCILSGLDNS